MIDFHGVKTKNKKFSLFIVLDDIFTIENQKHFFKYFNEQQAKIKWYNEFEPLNIQVDYNILHRPYEPLKEFFEYLIDKNIFYSLYRFQTIRNKGIGQHRDGGYENFNIEENLWDSYWIWFRLSQDKKIFFGENQEIEFENRAMLFNGFDYHGSPGIDYKDYDKPEWSILMRGTPTQDFKDEFNLY